MPNPTLDPQQLLNSLQWRYAVKQFDPEKKITPALWQTLEESLVLTPSSYGLQPWKFFVITDQQIREPLIEHSWNQKQVADCSHLIVFSIHTKITEAYVDRFIAHSAKVRNIDVDSLNSFRQMIMDNVVHGKKGEKLIEWATKQAFIALGNFMTSAALLGVDTCPMEGFIHEKYDEALGLSAKGLKTVVICPAGYRSSEDKYAGMAKVRFAKEEVIEYI